MTNNESKGPFEGLLVIDMTHVLNGPFGTQLLCNMGARVIKVEPPGHGDVSWPPEIPDSRCILK